MSREQRPPVPEDIRWRAPGFGPLVAHWLLAAMVPPLKLWDWFTTPKEHERR